MYYLSYNPKLKEIARKLRKNSTLAETVLWNHLKGGQRFGLDFHRQKPIGNYIVDFYCHKLKLVIEIDGKTHDFKNENDILRQCFLESIGPNVIRISDLDVKHNIWGVVKFIDNWIIERTPSRPGRATPL